MSTRSTIKHTDSWHLYEELMEDQPDNIYLRLDRKEYDGSSIEETIKIPWEAALGLHKYVSRYLEHEANLKDPAWLSSQIEELTAEIAELENSDSGFRNVLKLSATLSLENYQERLKALENSQE